MKILVMLAMMVSLSMAAHAEMQAPIPLWPDGAPGALGSDHQRYSHAHAISARPRQGHRRGDGDLSGRRLRHLAPHEGNDYALWLNQHGVTCFVLKYRLGSEGYRHPAMLQDAARAVRLVRARAADWKIDPKRVGIMGSSAGGHLASTLMTHFDSGQHGCRRPG